PPQTLGAVRPASLATSTKVTGEIAWVAECDALTSVVCDAPTDGHGSPVPLPDARTTERFHFQSGVARASSKVLPRRTNEEPRKRRRGEFICWLAWMPVGWMRVELTEFWGNSLRRCRRLLLRR